MSSDSDQTPQAGKRKKFLFPVSEDSDDSDYSIVQLRTRKKIFRVISEDETSGEESDFRTNENDVNYESSTSNTYKKINLGESSEDSDWQSDWTSSSDVESEKCQPIKRKVVGKGKKKLTNPITSSPEIESESSGDEHAEKCPICLLPFKKQQIGNPSSCEHCFCLECLMEWSKNINTCPVDRQTFTVIHVRNALGGNIVKHVPVEVAPRVEDQVQVDPTFCEVCHQCDREDRMLLCDGCDSGYHLECLTPPMDEVPMGEWFCPECTQNSQNDAEAVDIDLDEISDLMEEARRLGVSYGRTRTGVTNENQVRIVPRTRHTERVRAIIRSRARIYENPQTAREQTFDPNQPSTSSGLDSYGDNSRSRSPSSNTSNSRPSGKPPSRGNRSSKTTMNKHSSRNGSTVVREVRITEYNEDGEEEEIVTYVKVAVGKKSRGGRSRKMTRRRRKTRKYRRQVRRKVSRVLASGRKRLARSLGICKPSKNAKLLVPVVKSKSSVSDRAGLSLSRYSAGINQVSLFGTGLGLGYSPPGSDAEEDYSVSSGAVISVQRRSVLPSTRRRVNLKTISNPINIEEPEVVDILSSIISSQETWHSKKSNAVLKADGLVVVEKKGDENSSKGSSPKKEKRESSEETISRTGTPIEMSNINPNDITQAPMYNNPCGGGNRGNFRGAYRDNGRHSHGGQNYGRDSLSGGGRHSYGGSGARDNFGNRDFGPPAFYNPNFEQCGPPMFAGNPPFRGRNPQHFRNERFRFPPPERHQFNFNEGFERHPFERFPRPRPPPPPGPLERPQNNFPPSLPEDTLRGLPSEQPERVNAQAEAEVSSSSLTRPDDDCDIYCDIETTNKDCDAQENEQSDSTALLPPPEPPSSLLDFDENSKSDKDSDQELVIDDSHKDDTPKADKYDPFAADSDTNDSDKLKKDSEQSDTSLPKDLPPTSFAGTSNIVHPPVPSSPSVPTANRDAASGIRLTAYDDDDDEDSQADCPNFSVYSSQTMDVARHTEQELSQQIGPLEPPPLPPSIPDDDDIIVGDVQACDLADIPEPSDPYVEALRKERQALSKIPPKKISHDSRGKITFKIGNKLKINNRLTTLHDDKDTVEREEKPVNEVKKEENVDEAPIIRDEERRKIASGKVSEDEEEMSIHNEDKEEKDKESVNTISNDTEKEDTNEEMASSPITSKIEEAKKMMVDEEVSESSKEMDTAEVDSNSVLPTTDTLQFSPKRVEADLDVETASEDESEGSKPVTPITVKVDEEDEGDNDDDDDEEDEERNELKTSNLPDDVDSEKDSPEASGLDRLEDEEIEQFPIEKDHKDEEKQGDDTDAQKEWESDGAYTPCKDELPIREGKSDQEALESGLEPITPTKDKLNDDLDGCRTPADYAGLGTEAISETDEAMNFEDELALLNMRKEKEMEDGEILDESKSAPKEEKSKSKDDDNKKKKKKDKKEKSKETEKNKENISSDNQVAWKKLSKSTKERPYRDKDRRSKSKEKEKEREKDKEKEKEKDKDKDKSKKKAKEVVKKKEKRKEMPRYDVRKIVAEKPARPRKDEYGRDIREKSRSRSRSRSSSRVSFSRDRRSRSYSKARSRSRSRLRVHRSWSRDHRSYSKSYRSLSRRRSLSRGRRKSPKRRSGSRRRSLSRRQSVSRRRSRSPSRKRRSLSPRRRSRRRSLSKSRDRRKEKSKKYKSRSRSRNRKRSRSKSPKRLSKSREKKHSKRKLQSRSRSKGRSCSRDRNRNWDQISEKLVEHEQHFSRERDRDERDSWSAQWTPSWSRSRSKSLPPMQQEPMTSREWSPSSVLDTVSVPPKNLTVILTNKEAIKKKKKERRKESKKSKDSDKKRKGKRNRTPPPSKEVFASGDNILVSVCFNKDNETSQPPVPELPETIPLMPPVKRRRRDTLPSELPKRSKKEKTKDKRSKSPKPKKDKKKKSKAAEIAATKKPVAVIDLDQSPFREQTPSPRDVIVLSDDDDKQVQEVATPEQRPPSQESPPREQFVSQGPKTPPEPQIKFSINKQPSNLRPSMLNPLLEEEEEEEMDERAEEELEMRAQEELELRLKIGPNTPPEPPTSPPTSPDVYDPFDPTKSRSPTPDASQEATPNDDRDRNRRGSPRKHDSGDGNLQEEPTQQQDRQSQEKQLEKPKIISMVTIKRASPPRDTSPVNEVDVDTTTSANSPPKSQQSQQAVQSTSNPFATINPVLATVAAAVQRSGVFNAAAPNSTQRNLLQANRISPSNQPKQQQQQQQGVFANSGKSSRLTKTGQGKSQTAMGQNGNDTGLETVENVDMSSPYSPGSTLSDGIFDPPSPTNFTNSPIMGATVSTTTTQLAKNNATKITKTSTDKKDAFDVLFGAAPTSKPTSKPARNNKKSDKDKKKKSTNPKVGVRMDENQLQILDDLPSSAVEMQVKDKFLKKLNRQERVVEEVKLVLKPHYTKKHVTKEEYKDIMRKAVPKICHNKTGEINPKKIAHLIEAYVKKCRGSKKKPTESSGSKISKTSKTLWS